MLSWQQGDFSIVAMLETRISRPHWRPSRGTERRGSGQGVRGSVDHANAIRCNRGHAQGSSKVLDPIWRCQRGTLHLELALCFAQAADELGLLRELIPEPQNLVLARHATDGYGSDRTNSGDNGDDDRRYRGGTAHP